MKLFDFVKRFIQNRLGKKDLRNRIRTILQKYEEVVLPTLTSIRQSPLNPADGQYQSAYGKQLYTAFLKTLPSNMRVRMKWPYFAILNQSFDHAVKVLNELDEVVGKDLPETLYIDGLTYQTTSILRLIEFLDFMADYSTRQFDYLAVAECEPNNALPSTKSEEAAIRMYQPTFFRLVEMFYQQPKDIMAAISRTPEILVLTDEALPAAVANGTDPLKMGNIPLVSPLFLFVGERIVDWDFARWERMRKEKKSIELRIEILTQRAGGGQVDPRTESIINGYQRELTILRDKIERLQSKAMGPL